MIADLIDTADSVASKRSADAATALTLLDDAAAARAAALATQLGYEGELSARAVEDRIRFHQRRAVEHVLETGKGLLLLKELTGHGEFTQRVEALGFAPRMAQKFMQATVKFAKSEFKALLTAPGMNQTKLLELMVLDDDQLEALADGGIDGLQLDEIDCLSTTELKKRLREAVATNEATDRVLADKAAELAKLQRGLERQRVALTDYPAEFEGYIAQVQEAQRAIANKIGALDLVRLDAMRIEPGEGEGESLDKARQMLAVAMEQALRHAAELVDALRLSFDRTLGAWGGR